MSNVHTHGFVACARNVGEMCRPVAADLQAAPTGSVFAVVW